MSNIVLGTATQQNLLALQNINTQLGTTQGHLSTGLAVASATDDAVKYFQAQSLTNRANDLSTRKDAIAQGIQSLTAATNGITSVISVLQQMEGIVNGAATQTATQRASAMTQFNTLGQQLTTLLNDSSYQGLNLVNSTASNLTLQFSITSSSTLKITGQNLLFSKLVTGGKALGKGSVRRANLMSAQVLGGEQQDLGVHQRLQRPAIGGVQGSGCGPDPWHQRQLPADAYVVHAAVHHHAPGRRVRPDRGRCEPGIDQPGHLADPPTARVAVVVDCHVVRTGGPQAVPLNDDTTHLIRGRPSGRPFFFVLLEL